MTVEQYYEWLRESRTRDEYVEALRQVEGIVTAEYIGLTVALTFVSALGELYVRHEFPF